MSVKNDVSVGKICKLIFSRFMIFVECLFLKSFQNNFFNAPSSKCYAKAWATWVASMANIENPFEVVSQETL